jgi:hypothetical protein
MSKDGGTFFWEINTGLKAKISYYNENGKGTINLKYPKIKKGIALAFMESTSCMTIKAKRQLFSSRAKTAIVGTSIFQNIFGLPMVESMDLLKANFPLIHTLS